MSGMSGRSVDESYCAFRTVALKPQPAADTVCVCAGEIRNLSSFAQKIRQKSRHLGFKEDA
jgi:hypothetical protein